MAKKKSSSIKTFCLNRVEDETGVSGTGIVAQGAVFSNNKVVISWLSKHSSITTFNSIKDMLSVHGHSGKTQIVWDKKDHSNNGKMESVADLVENWYMDEPMNSFEYCLEMMKSVNSWLTEGAMPPPIKAADRAKEGLPALNAKTKTGISPPPIPAAAMKKKEVKPLMVVGKKAIVNTALPKGKKDLGISRAFSMHTTPGTNGNADARQSIGWAANQVGARAARGESIQSISSEIRNMLSEAPFGRLRAMKPMVAVKPMKAMKAIKGLKAMKAMKAMKSI